MRLFTADTHYFNAGVIVDGEKVVRAAPILRWMIGKTVADLAKFVESKGGTLYEHPVAVEAQPMRLIVAGSRGFRDYARLSKVLDSIRERHQIECIISGACPNSPDVLGERYATEHNIPLRRKPADWNQFGKAAGAIRNREMAEEGTHLLVFWDGKSPGTKNMIAEATQKGLKVHVCRF